MGGLVVHSFTNFLPLIPLGVTGAYLSILREGRGYAEQVASFSAGLKCRDKQASTSNLDQLTYPQFACFWDVGGNQSTWRELTKAPGEHVNSKQKHPDLGLKPSTFLL